MKPNRWIILSRWGYARLLNLYPHDHRTDYGPQMLQMFTDQCRFAYKEAGVRGLFVLWLYTLLDLCSSSLREHLDSPRLLCGVLEAVPNEPLPWKGVLLVLIPGLLFFTGQIAQLSGADWFFLLYHRAAYLLIIPVLLIWLFLGKVPIWGLIPIGLLYNTLWWVIYRLQHDAINYTNSTWPGVMQLFSKYDTDTRGAVLFVSVLIALILLIGWTMRRRWMTQRAWVWIGAYTLFGIIFTLYRVHSGPIYPKVMFSDIWHWNACYYGGFLLLIVFGALLARRHGQLAILLPLGYMLPTVLFGRFNADWETPQFMFLVSAGALVFRLLVALVAPIWILRVKSGEVQRRTTAIALLSVLAIEMILRVGVYGLRGILSINALNFIVLDQLILAAGIFLALELYQAAALTGAKHQLTLRISTA
jgi:hypothetical protein